MAESIIRWTSVISTDVTSTLWSGPSVLLLDPHFFSKSIGLNRVGIGLACTTGNILFLGGNCREKSNDLSSQTLLTSISSNLFCTSLLLRITSCSLSIPRLNVCSTALDCSSSRLRRNDLVGGSEPLPLSLH
ncbi:hypothetical protein ACFX14_000404 [Malus domestica]